MEDAVELDAELETEEAPRLNSNGTQIPSPPSIPTSLSIHPEAYRPPADAELLAPEISDREAVCEELIEHCKAELEVTKDRGRKARLHYECARLYEYPLGDLQASLEHYETAQTLRPRHLPTISGLRRVLTLRGDWEAALDALSKEASLTELPDERAALHFERALIFEESLSQGPEARAAYQGVLKQIPGDAASLRALARAALRDGDHAGDSGAAARREADHPTDRQALAGGCI